MTPLECPHFIRIQELEKRMELHLASNKQAVELAATALSARLETMNELSATLTDQAAAFITRAEYDDKHRVLERNVQDLKEIAAEGRGKASQNSVVVAQTLAMIGVFGAVIDWIRHIGP